MTDIFDRVLAKKPARKERAECGASFTTYTPRAWSTEYDCPTCGKRFNLTAAQARTCGVRVTIPRHSPAAPKAETMSADEYWRAVVMGGLPGSYDLGDVADFTPDTDLGAWLLEAERRAWRNEGKKGEVSRVWTKHRGSTLERLKKAVARSYRHWLLSTTHENSRRPSLAWPSATAESIESGDWHGRRCRRFSRSPDRSRVLRLA